MRGPGMSTHSLTLSRESFSINRGIASSCNFRTVEVSLTCALCSVKGRRSSTPKSVFLLLSESTRQTLRHWIDAHPEKSIDRRSSRHRHSTGPRSSFSVLRDLDTNRLDRRQSFFRPQRFSGLRATLRFAPKLGQRSSSTLFRPARIQDLAFVLLFYGLLCLRRPSQIRTVSLASDHRCRILYSKLHKQQR